MIGLASVSVAAALVCTDPVALDAVGARLLQAKRVTFFGATAEEAGREAFA